jgi:hypothetical protein
VRVCSREVEVLNATSAANDFLPSPDPGALQRSVRTRDPRGETGAAGHRLALLVITVGALGLSVRAA